MQATCAEELMVVLPWLFTPAVVGSINYQYILNGLHGIGSCSNPKIADYPQHVLDMLRS